MNNKVNSLIKQFDDLKSQRTLFESQWQEISELCLPTKNNFITKNSSGIKKAKNVFDSTPLASLQTLTAGMFSYLVNPSTDWFDYHINSDLMNNASNQSSLHNIKKEAYNILAGSNFYQQIMDWLLEYNAFGNACMYVEDDYSDILRFFSRALSESYFRENNKGQIDSVYRYFTMKVKQLVDKFGLKNVSKEVQEKYKNKEYEHNIDILFIVEPRQQRDINKKNKLNKRFASYWIEKEEQFLLAEGGYDDFPYYVARGMKLSSDYYGYSIPMIARGDIHMINDMLQTLIVQTQKVVKGVWAVESNSVTGGKLDVRPGAVNTIQPGKEPPVNFVNQTNLPIGFEFADRTSQSIKSQFFADLFRLPNDETRRTAVEIMQRTQNQMLLLSPVVLKICYEFLDPLLTYLFKVVISRNPSLLTDELYEFFFVNGEIKNIKLKINYTSPLVKSQRLNEIKNIQAFIEVIGMIVQFKPDVIDNIDFDKIVTETADIFDTSYVIKPQHEIDRIREERNLLMQQQQQQEQIASQAETAQRIGDTIAKTSKAKK